MATHSTPTGVVLDLRLPAGAVEVTTADTDSTTVELEPMRGGDAAQETIAATREEAVRQSDGSVRVIVRVPERGRLLRRSEELVLRVAAPHGARIQVSTASADVRCDGRLGATSVKTASGDITLADVSGNAETRTASGDVRVGPITGDADLQSMSGSITADDISGSAKVKTMSGDVSLGLVDGSLTASSMSGDLTVTGVRAGSVELSTMSGDIEVGVARGTRVFMDVRTLSGEARSDLPVSEESDAAGGAEVSLRASTKSGDVHVRRAPERTSANA